jgi:hypothetical protein
MDDLTGEVCHHNNKDNLFFSTQRVGLFSVIYKKFRRFLATFFGFLAVEGDDLDIDHGKSGVISA